jgi:competence ComEA-like helix-hairpin-helix protein
MKSWHFFTIGLLAGLIIAAVAVLATNRPPGQPIQLILPPSPIPDIPNRSDTAPVLVEENCRVDLNTATLADLESLPGIGPSKAQDILDFRQANGPFLTMDDLDNVTGIGPAIIDEIRGMACVIPQPAQTP